MKILKDGVEVEVYSPLTDALIEEGRKKGFIQGREEGFIQGREEGFIQGKKLGFILGRKEFITEDRAKIKEIQRNSKNDTDFVNQVLNYFDLLNE